MRYYKSILCVICAFAVNVPAGQQEQQTGKMPAVVVPGDVGLSAVVVQAGCPMRIKNIEKLILLNGWTGYRYEISNESDQPIRSYSIAEVNSKGASAIFSRRPKTTSGVLMPNESDTYDKTEDRVEIIPLTRPLRDQFKLEKPLKTVLALEATQLTPDQTRRRNP